jgi:hypothetical protein
VTGWPGAVWWPTFMFSAVPRWLLPMTHADLLAVDAIFKPHGPIVEEARVVAEELGWPQWWLNEQASAYATPGGDPDAPRVFDHPGLRVSAASPEHLLAMKVLAARRRDAEDIRFLVKRMDLKTAAEVLALCADIFPEEEVPDRARLILEDAFEDQ